MTDSKIPSSRPSAPVSGTGSGATKSGGPQGAVTPVSARTPVQDAVVRQSPPGLLLLGQHAELEGSILSSNPAQGQISVSTPQGEVVLNSGADIPEGTAVILRLVRRRDQMLASLTILNRKDAAQKQAQDALAPAKPGPAPLKAGDTVTALRISSSEEPAPQPAAPQPSVHEVAQALRSLSAAQLRQLPGPPPLPPETLYTLTQSQNIEAALQRLPPEQLQALLDYAARADVQAALNDLQNAAQNAPPPASSDSDIVNVIRTQVGAAAQAGTPGARGPLSGLSSLLLLLQTLENSGVQAGGGATLINNMQGAFPADTGGLLPQNMTSLNILAVSLPDAQGHAAAPSLPESAGGAQVLAGEVEAVTPGGYPVIATADGQDFVLKTQVDVPVGSKLLFTTSRISTAQAFESFGVATTADAGIFNPLISNRWPALQDTLAALPAQAAQLMTAGLPSVAARFAPATLLFLAALQMDSLQNWLGENTLQTLRQNGKQSLIDRLAGDFSKISAQARQPLPGGWRAISLPLMHEGEMSQAQFFWRRQDESEDDGAGGVRKKPMTRFILNLHLSRMGDMQLDGLMRQKRLDMILRGERILPPALRQELAQAYAGAMAQTGMQGSIGFQVRADKWVDIEMPHQSGLSA